MASKPIRIGAIGCGRRVRHVLSKTLEHSDKLQVVALCDPSDDSIKLAREQLKCPDARRYTSHRALANAADIDWVFVGSWNTQHRKHIVAGLEAGKHVFTEKPMATSLADCAAIRDAWEKSKRQLFVGFTLRYSPHYQKVRELIQAGRIGKVISMEFNETLSFGHGGHIFKNWRRLRGNSGGHLIEKCCHDIDVANWLVGSLASRVASFGGNDFFLPKNVRHMKRLGKDAQGRPAYMSWPTATFANPFTGDHDVVDNQVAIIEYANKVRATFHTNANAGIPERRFYICGTEGAIRADVISGKIELARIGFSEQVQDISTTAKGGHGDGDRYEAEQLAQIMVKGKKPTTSFDEGLHASVTAIGIDRAMMRGRVVDMAPLWKQVGIKLAK